MATVACLAAAGALFFSTPACIDAVKVAVAQGWMKATPTDLQNHHRTVSITSSEDRGITEDRAQVPPKTGVPRVALG